MGALVTTYPMCLRQEGYLGTPQHLEFLQMLSSTFLSCELVCQMNDNEIWNRSLCWHWFGFSVWLASEIVFQPAYQKSSADFTISAKGSIRNENLSLSLSRRVYHYCKMFSSAPFSLLLVKFSKNSATNSCGHRYFTAPFELLAGISATRQYFQSLRQL